MSQYCVLIINWNSWDVLSRCLGALSRQTFIDFDVVVADNASEERPIQEVFANHPNIIFVQNEKNYGFAKANNELLKICGKSEWIILLNPDAFPEPDWLEQLVLFSARHPDYTFFGSRLLMAGDQTKLDGDGDKLNISGLAWRNGHGESPLQYSGANEIFSPCAAAAMYNRDALVAVGGFDEDFFCYLEDIDLGFRLRLAGHKCLLVPTAIVNHIGSATTGGQQGDFAVYYGHRNLVWTFVKNMPGILFWVFLPLHIGLNLFSLIWFTARGQRSVIFRAKRDALISIPAMWRKRRLIQSTRVATVSEILRVLDKRPVPWVR